MIKRELKVNFKSFIIWLGIILFIFLIVFMMYPTIMSNDKVNMLNETLKMFPKEMLKAFNMDIVNITTAFGWIKTEGMMFILLITGFYSSYLGGNILLKEENDKTIEYLNSLPISRTKIILNKILVSLGYIFLFIIILFIFNFIGLSIIENFERKLFILLSFSPFLTSIVFFSISLFISTFFHKTKKMVGLSLGIVFLNYFVNVFSNIDNDFKYLNYFSIYALADIRNIITNCNLNYLMIILSLLISFIFLILSIIRYNRKDLV